MEFSRFSRKLGVAKCFGFVGKLARFTFHCLLLPSHPNLTLKIAQNENPQTFVFRTNFSNFSRFSSAFPPRTCSTNDWAKIQIKFHGENTAITGKVEQTKKNSIAMANGAINLRGTTRALGTSERNLNLKSSLFIRAKIHEAC
jgi:hypothetical protein